MSEVYRTVRCSGCGDLIHLEDGIPQNECSCAEEDEIEERGECVIHGAYEGSDCPRC